MVFTPQTAKQPLPVLPAERRVATVSKWLGIVLLCLSFAPSSYTSGDVPQFYLLAEYSDNLLDNMLTMFPALAGLLLLTLGYIPRVDLGAWFLLMGLTPFCLSSVYQASIARGVYPVLAPFGATFVPNLVLGLVVCLAIVALMALWRLRLNYSTRFLRISCGVAGGLILLCGGIAFWSGNTLMCYLLFGTEKLPAFSESSPGIALVKSLQLWWSALAPETLGALGLFTAFFGGKKLFRAGLFLAGIFLVFPLASALVEVIIYFRMTHAENALLKNSLVDLFQFGRTLTFILLLWTGSVILIAKRLWLRKDGHGRN